MKTLSLFLIAVLVFAAVPAFACGGDDKGKDKDEQAFTIEAQYLCGGGNKGSDDADKTCDQPKPDDQPQCGGDKGDKPKPEPSDPSFMCGGDKGGDDKGQTKT